MSIPYHRYICYTDDGYPNCKSTWKWRLRHKVLVQSTEETMIERENFDWGIRLTAHPFKDGDHSDLMIQADIGPYKHNRGSDVRITFTGVPAAAPLRLGTRRFGTRRCTLS
jgi:hypothetical protein